MEDNLLDVVQFGTRFLLGRDAFSAELGSLKSGYETKMLAFFNFAI